MTQVALKLVGKEIHELKLPEPDEYLMENIKWGRLDAIFTPAFWATQMWQVMDTHQATHYQLGKTLKEEVAACLLGGHGIPAEVGIKAYEAIRDSGILEKKIITEKDVNQILSKPLPMNGKQVKYRFVNQKSRYLSRSLNALSEHTPSSDDHIYFRDWLANNLLGVGMKTASWVTRNYLKSDQVAILDIHIIRAGLFIGLFDHTHKVTRDYKYMEEQFLLFSHHLKAKPSILDDLMWKQIKSASSVLHNLTKH